MEIKVLNINNNMNNNFRGLKKDLLKKAVANNPVNEIKTAAAAISSVALAGIAINNIKKSEEEMLAELNDELKDCDILPSEIKWELSNCKNNDGTYHLKAVELLKSYARNYKELSPEVSLGYVLHHCHYEDESFSESALDKLIETSNDMNRFIDAVVALEELSLESLGSEILPRDFIETFLKNNEIYSVSSKERDLCTRIFAQMTIAVCNEDKNMQTLLYSLVKDKNMPLSIMRDLLNFANKVGCKKIISMIEKTSIPTVCLWNAFMLEDSPKSVKNNLSEENLNKFYQVKTMVLKHPELYVGSFALENNNPNLQYNYANRYFYRQGYSLVQFFSPFEISTIDYILRQKFTKVTALMPEYSLLSDKQKLLVKEFQDCKKADGSNLTPKEKFSITQILRTYDKNNLSTDQIEKMIKAGNIDFISIYKPLFEKLLKACNMSKREIKNFDYLKFSDFDLSKAHLILKTIGNDKTGDTQYLVWAMFNEDFNSYIHDKKNIFGRKNLETIETFEENGLDYSKWINIDKDLSVQFKNESVNSGILKNLSKDIVEYIETLRNNGLKNFIDKRYSEFIKNDKLVLPKDLVNNKTNLTNFVKNILAQLHPIQQKAKENLEIEDKKLKAMNTLTVFYHIEEVLKTLEQMKDNKTDTQIKEADYTIKMWDRNPIKDIFQGNYSDCCIQMDGSNGQAMAQYLLYTMFNMIEILDNNTGKTIGNSLCYFAKNDMDELVLVLDNIEIHPNYKLLGEAGVKFRKAIVEYARRVAKTVCPDENVKIYLGTKYNDVETSDIVEKSKTVRILGKLSCDEEYYLDAMNGWIDLFIDDKSETNIYDLTRD